MMPNIEFDKLHSIAMDQHAKGTEHQIIEMNLREAGGSDEWVQIIIKEIKSLNYLKRKKRGIKLVLCGAFFLVFGFAITLLLFHSGNSISLAMYGFTITGLCLLLWGMIDLMGW